MDTFEVKGVSLALEDHELDLDVHFTEYEDPFEFRDDIKEFISFEERYE